MLKKIITCITAITLFGCATPYKKNGFGFNGGYDSTELAPNYFRINFKGNEKTSIERASDFTLLRASELMIERNCQSFLVTNATSNIKKNVLFSPTTQTTNQTTTFIGNSTFTQTSSSIPVMTGAILEFPRVTIEAKCSDKAPDIDQGIYDSKFINKSLKLKYNIKD